MWRMWNNISRAFRTHVYNPRPSVGVLVEEEQELVERHDHTGHGSCTPSEHAKNRGLNRDEQCDCKENDSSESGWRKNINGGDGGEERQNNFHHEFWHLLHHPQNMSQAVNWGPVFMWGSDRENFKRRTSSRLLYHVLFALPGRFAPASIRSVLPPIKEELLEQAQPQPGQLAIKDAAGAAIDEKINISKTETLELAVREFQKACREYSACSESLLGLKAANGGDMPAAVEHLQRSCLLGNMSACFNLGLCYEMGSGVPQDEAKAAYYYLKAAKGGHKMALYNLGLMCLKHGKERNGEGDTKRKATKRGKGDLILSKEMGLEFLEEAARLGLPEAQTYLGLYHMDECQEPSRAVSYFKAAAEQNDSEGQYLLAMCYEQGLGVEINECLAARFYSMAAQTGHDVALYNLGVFNEEGLGGLPKNKATALEMYRKAARLGNVEAEERLGDILGSDDSDSTNTELTSSQDDTDNKREESFPNVVHGHPEEQELAEKQDTNLAYDNSAIEGPLFSLLSPSASYPSLRSLSSVSLPKPQMKPIRVSSSQYLDRKFMVQDSSEFRVATDKPEGFLGKVHFFLGMAPTAMTLDHDLEPGIPFGSLSKNFIPRSIPVSPFGSVEEEEVCMLPSLHRSRTFSDFSMIGI